MRVHLVYDLDPVRGGDRRLGDRAGEAPRDERLNRVDLFGFQIRSRSWLRGLRSRVQKRAPRGGHRQLEHVVRGEPDRGRDRTLQPRQAHPFEQPVHRALLCVDIPQSLPHPGVYSPAVHLHAPPDHVQGVRHRLRHEPGAAARGELVPQGHAVLVPVVVVGLLVKRLHRLKRGEGQAAVGNDAHERGAYAGVEGTDAAGGEHGVEVPDGTPESHGRGASRRRRRRRRG